MAAIDWIVLFGGVVAIAYCALTMPKPMVLTREEWRKLPENRRRRRNRNT